jgi:histidinol-phosphate aminotransferase
MYPVHSHDILIKPLNGPALVPGHMHVATALPDDNRRFVDVLREVLSHA